MALIQFKRGQLAQIEAAIAKLKSGEPLVDLESKKLYIAVDDSGNYFVLDPKSVENAATADKLKTPQNFSIEGEVIADAVPFDGSSPVVFTAKLKEIGEGGTGVKLTFDRTGRITGMSELSVEDLPSGIGPDKLTGVVLATEKGTVNGVATLDESGHVPAAQLPSYVDDIIDGYFKSEDNLFYKEPEFTTPITGESGKIYCDLNTNKAYRFSGSIFVVIPDSLALGETSATAFPGDKGKVAYDHAQIKQGNPHGTTIEDLNGLSKDHAEVKASAEALGHVKVDGVTLGIAEDGTLKILVIDGGLISE